MRIQNNMMALNTYRQYNIANNQTAGYAEKLSSGYQINRAGDDAAGLAISEKMRAQIRGLNMASKNSLDAVSLIQTAEGALQSTHDILQRMRELAVQAASDTNEQVIDRGALDQEFQALKKEIDETARTTRFNDQNLIDGTFQKKFYSTDVVESMLTTGTTAQVSRVGVKSDYKQSGIYNIDVKYINPRDVQYAKASRVTTGGANGIQTVGLNENSAIQTASFTAVDGAMFNGKTFTLSAKGGQTQDIYDSAEGLRVTMTDGDTTYTGVVIATDGIEANSVITINFAGVGTLQLDLRGDRGYTTDPNVMNVFNISSMLDGREIKFVKSPEVTTDFVRKTQLAGSDTYSVNFDTSGGWSQAAGSVDQTNLNANGTNYTGVATIVNAANNGSTAGTTKLTAPTFDLGGTSATITFDAALANLFNGTGMTPAAIALQTSSKMTVDLGDAGTYEIILDFSTIDTTDQTTGATSAAALINSALTDLNSKLSVTKDDADLGTTKINITDNLAAGDKYENTTLTATGSLVLAADGSVDSATDLAFNIDYADPAKTDIANKAYTISIKQIGTTTPNVFDVEAAQVVTVDMGDYGKFTLNISGAKGRTLAEFNTALANAFANLDGTNGSLVLGDVSEGQDYIEGSAAGIALTLNGEVVTVGQNDKSATFDSTGLTIKFDALDLSTVNSDQLARAKFTTNPDPSLSTTIRIAVRENDGKALTIQTGANQGDELDINIDAMDLEMLGLTDSSIATQKSASRAITEVNNAINQVSTQRAALGALQNRLNFKIANLDTSAENLQAAESRIRDTDMAKVMTAFTKSNILGQAATAMLAQANSQPQNVLQLLR